MRALLAAAALLLALPAGAQTVRPEGSLTALDLSVTRVDPGYLWFDAPNTTDAGDARIRIVFAGREGAAALTPNQYWIYARSYKRHLAHLSMRGSVHRALPRARHLAFRDVAARYPNLRVEGFDLKRTYGDALVTPDF